MIQKIQKRIDLNKFTLTSLAGTVGFVVLMCSLGWILGRFEIAFRSWVWAVSIALTAILVMAFLIGCLASLQRYRKFASRVLRFIGTAVLSGGILLTVYYGILGTIFTLKPEHVVERGGMKLVAEVSAFLEVDVDYYAYKNWFVRGSKPLISEWYGSGGYDPFTRESMPAPKRTVYNDENLRDR